MMGSAILFIPMPSAMPGPAGTIARNTYGFVAKHWAAFARRLWLPSLFLVLIALLFLRWATCLGLGDCRGVTGTVGPFGVIALLVLLVVIAIVLVASMRATAWSEVLRPAAPAPSPPPSKLELTLRLTAMAVVRGVLVAAAGITSAAIASVAVILFSRVEGRLSPVVYVIGVFAVLLCMGYVATRLSLAGPACVGGPQLGLAASWVATRHRVGLLRAVDARLQLPGFLLLSLLAAAAVLLVAAFGSLPGPPTVCDIDTLRHWCAAAWARLGWKLVPLALLAYLVALAQTSILLAGRVLAFDAARGAPAP